MSDSTSQTMQVNSNCALIAGPASTEPAAQFKLAPATNCTSYPEMQTSISGETFEGRGVDKPIIGFADIHTHVGMSNEMSYAGDVGPSAGGVLYGGPIHRFEGPTSTPLAAYSIRH